MKNITKIILIASIPKGSKEFITFNRNLRKADVSRYFRSIKPKAKLNYTKEDYCARCGRIFAPNLTYQKGRLYKGFNLCPECYEDKITKKPEAIPDIEDVERFKVSIEF